MDGKLGVRHALGAGMFEPVVQVEDAWGSCLVSPIRLARLVTSVCLLRGCVRWRRRRTLS